MGTRILPHLESLQFINLIGFVVILLCSQTGCTQGTSTPGFDVDADANVAGLSNERLETLGFYAALTDPMRFDKNLTYNVYYEVSNDMKRVSFRYDPIEPNVFDGAIQMNVDISNPLVQNLDRSQLASRLSNLGIRLAPALIIHQMTKPSPMNSSLREIAIEEASDSLSINVPYNVSWNERASGRDDERVIIIRFTPCDLANKEHLDAIFTVRIQTHDVD